MPKDTVHVLDSIINDCWAQLAAIDDHGVADGWDCNDRDNWGAMVSILTEAKHALDADS